MKTKFIKNLIIIVVILLYSQHLAGQKWTGASDNRWDNKNNWNPKKIPSSTSDVIIPNGASRYPIISLSTVAEAKNITIGSRASLTIQNGAKLNVYGSISDTGVLNSMTGSTVVFMGSSNATIEKIPSNYNIIFYEDFEGDTSKWVFEGDSNHSGWRVSADPLNPSNRDASIWDLKNNKSHDYCNTCSYAYYDMYIDIDLTNYYAANLSFKWRNGATGMAYSFVMIDANTLNGLSELQGKTSWQVKTINIDNYCGEKRRLGFRFFTNNVNSIPGLCIDSIVVSGKYSVENFYNLVIAKTSSAQVNLLSRFKVDNNLKINSGSIFNAQNYDLFVYGDIENNGVFNPGTSTVYLNGSKDQKIKGTSKSKNFYNLVVNKSENTKLIIGDSLVSGDTLSIINTNGFKWISNNNNIQIGNGNRTIFKLDGNITINYNNIFELRDTSVLILTGNFYNYGIFKENNSRVIFSGTTNSSITSIYTLPIYKDGFEIDPSSNGWNLEYDQNSTGWIWSSGRQNTGNYDIAVCDARFGIVYYDYAWDKTTTKTVSKTIDLSNYDNASMSFYWKCGGAPYQNSSVTGDYGLVMINNDTVSGVPGNRRLYNQLSYIKHPQIDLTPYCGKGNITIKFIFVSDNAYGPYQASSPGLCIDDLEIMGGIKTRQVFYDLKIDKSNSKSLYVYSPIEIKNILDLGSNVIKTFNDTVKLSKNAVVLRNEGFVEGNLAKYFDSEIRSFTFDVGTGNCYSPVKLNFNNVTNPGYLVVKSVGEINSLVPVSVEAMKRYWRCRNIEGLKFDTVYMTFRYCSCDFNTELIEKVDEYQMLLGKYYGGWSYPQVITRDTAGDGGEITIKDYNNLYSSYTCFKYSPPLFRSGIPSGEHCLNDSLILIANVKSSTSKRYQWYKNDTLITGATDSFYVLSSMQYRDSGVYKVKVDNFFSSVYSNDGKHSFYKEDAGVIKRDTFVFIGDSTYLSISSLWNKKSLYNHGNYSAKIVDRRIVNRVNLIGFPVGLNSQQFTIEFWLNPLSSTSYNQIIGADWWNFLFHLNKNGALFVGVDTFYSLNQPYRISHKVLGNGYIEINKWRHWAFVFDNGVERLYRDGELVAELNGSMLAQRLDTLYLSNIDGYLDELRVWNVVRTEGDIIDNMYKPLSGGETGLLAYYNFEGDLKDKSKNGKDGIEITPITYSDEIPSELKVKWNTGDTTWSIKVKPITTTTYIATIYTGCNEIIDTAVLKTNIVIDACDNKIIQKGNSTLLTVTGGDIYSWSTGDRGSSITVSPTHHTTYYVTGWKGDNYKVDSVIVYVVNSLSDITINIGDSVGLYTDNSKYSVHFDGIDDRIYLGNSSALQMRGSMTIEAWIKLERYNDNGSSVYYKSPANEGQIMISKSGKVVYYYGNGTNKQAVISDGAIELNKWTHIAIVRDFNNMKIRIYINGNMDVEKNAIYSYSGISSSNAYVGWGGSGSIYKGNIDEFRIWNTALSGDKIKGGMYKVYNVNKETNLKVYLRFEEGENDTTYDATNNNVNGWLCAGLLNQTMSNMPIYSVDVPSVGLKYKWSNGETTPNIRVKPTSNTFYQVTVSNATTSMVLSSIIYINDNKKYAIDTVITDKSYNDKSSNMSDNYVKVYPNPVNKNIDKELSVEVVKTLLVENTEIIIEIVDVLGNIVYVVEDYLYNYKLKKVINVSNIKSGMYFVRIKYDNNVINQKLIIR